MLELWKPVLYGTYEVSDLGRVRRMKPGTNTVLVGMNILRRTHTDTQMGGGTVRNADVLPYQNTNLNLGVKMSDFTKVCKLLWEEELAQDLLEYSLLLVLIALIATASIAAVGHAVSDAFSNAAANLTTT